VDDATGALFDLAECSPALAGVQTDSIVGRHTVRVGGLPGLGFVQPTGVAQDGFTLHAGVCVPGGPRSRERLEHICRYAARPALASERLSGLDDGRVAYGWARAVAARSLAEWGASLRHASVHRTALTSAIIARQLRTVGSRHVDDLRPLM
jgi:hypothetical protein